MVILVLAPLDNPFAEQSLDYSFAYCVYMIIKEN